MIVAPEGEERAALEAEWCARAPGLVVLFQAIADDAGAFSLVPIAGGLEARREREDAGSARGSRLRLMAESSGQIIAYFFRMGSGGASYSYGGQALRAEALRPDQMKGWAAYLASSFDSAATPRGLVRGFQFPLPE